MHDQYGFVDQQGKKPVLFQPGSDFLPMIDEVGPVDSTFLNASFLLCYFHYKIPNKP